jgi:exonuclease III
MTSLLPFISYLRPLIAFGKPSIAVCRNYTSMCRDINPPPVKRRKTATSHAAPVARQISSVPQALPPLGTNSIRIFSWNINGITPFLQKSIAAFFPASKTQNDKGCVPLASLRGFLERHDWPSILFLQEVKITSTDLKTQDAVRNAINDKLSSEAGNDGPTYEAHFTLPNDPYNARGLRNSGKLYGVCSIVRTDLREKYNVNVRTVDWDKEGRISVVEIVSKMTKLAIFNIYAVNGTENPYRDPKTGANRGTRHDRKRQVHSLLMEECLALDAAGWDVLLAGDMNVAPDARDGYPKLRTFPQQHVINRVDFHEKLLEGKSGDGGLNGVDVWRKMHGDERRYTYYPRGRKWGTSCDRVDYVVAGRKMWEKGMVKACGIMDSEAERGPSDHCPVWVDASFGLRDGKEICM